MQSIGYDGKVLRAEGRIVLELNAHYDEKPEREELSGTDGLGKAPGNLTEKIECPEDWSQDHGYYLYDIPKIKENIEQNNKIVGLQNNPACHKYIISIYPLNFTCLAFIIASLSKFVVQHFEGHVLSGLKPNSDKTATNPSLKAGVSWYTSYRGFSPDGTAT